MGTRSKSRTQGWILNSFEHCLSRMILTDCLNQSGNLCYLEQALGFLGERSWVMGDGLWVMGHGFRVLFDTGSVINHTCTPPLYPHL